MTMSSARFLIGDVHDRLTEIPDNSVDFLVTSPPFLALRSYLPEDHPDKAKEIGSEATPAEFLDVLLQLAAEWGRVLAPHGSIAVELGDTYAGSGGAGGDYGDQGLRDGQPKFDGSGRRNRPADVAAGILAPTRRPGPGDRDRIPGWPLAKSLACIPQLYQVALAYGINPLTGQPSPAGRWRVRNLKPWIRSNPPVGALGDKERPATSYVIVACRATDRFFDLDAVRTHSDYDRPNLRGNGSRGPGHDVPGQKHNSSDHSVNAEGAPPRDWWHHVDAILDTELANRAATAGRSNGGKTHGSPKGGISNNMEPVGRTLQPAQGVHLRRALERAGILTTLEALDVSPKGYAGAHYAVWPPELVRLLIDEMCPARVCATCGQPSRRITSQPSYVPSANPSTKATRPAGDARDWASGIAEGKAAHSHKTDGGMVRSVTTLGWSDCGHNAWRPGHVLDPFAGSGTTLQVAVGMGRTATGIDIDERNAWLARERCGMFLEISDRPTSTIVDTRPL